MPGMRALLLAALLAAPGAASPGAAAQKSAPPSAATPSAIGAAMCGDGYAFIPLSEKFVDSIPEISAALDLPGAASRLPYVDLSEGESWNPEKRFLLRPQRESSVRIPKGWQPGTLIAPLRAEFDRLAALLGSALADRERFELGDVELRLKAAGKRYPADRLGRHTDGDGGNGAWMRLLIALAGTGTYVWDGKKRIETPAGHALLLTAEPRQAVTRVLATLHQTPNVKERRIIAVANLDLER